ncbi:MAG TPA: hypothetical protein VND83_02785 [Acidimicrobiales bacterium]|nr:hypothetical protein [Acidimicrobiales bacterium]
MNELTVTHVDDEVLARLVDSAPPTSAVLTDDHRRSLTARFRAVPDPAHRRLDAWSVETAGRAPSDFRWTPAAARRTLATAALRRMLPTPGLTLVGSVTQALDAQVARAQTGQARAGSLAVWLDTLGSAARGLVVAEAVGWAGAVLEVARGLEAPWNVAASDAYYDVAGARTTLRGRRDLEVARGDGLVVVRLRAGSPGTTAGAGLRVDLAVLALADSRGVAPSRVIGWWPEAGVVLAVDGSMEGVRAGARDLVRAAVVTRRHRLHLAA